MELKDIKTREELLSLSPNNLLDIFNKSIKDSNISGTDDRWIRGNMVYPIEKQFRSIEGVEAYTITTTNTKLEIKIDQIKLHFKVIISKTNKTKAVSKLRSKYVKVPGRFELEGIPKRNISIPVFEFNKSKPAYTEHKKGWTSGYRYMYFSKDTILGDMVSDVIFKERLKKEITDDDMIKQMIEPLVHRIYFDMGYDDYTEKDGKTYIKTRAIKHLKNNVPVEYQKKFPKTFEEINDYVKGIVMDAYGDKINLLREISQVYGTK